MMRRLLPVLWLAFVPARGLAAGYPEGMSGDDIRGLVAVAMVQAGRTGTPLLSQWRSFPPCAARPRVTPDADWTGVTLDCAAPQPWQRKVRIGPADAADDAAPAEVVTLREALPKGTILAPAHLVTRTAEAGESGAALGDPDAAVGRRLRQSLGAGQVLQARHLEQDFLVRAGDRVVLALEAGGMSVLAEGEALADGQLGQSVQVRSLSSGRTLTGTVADKRKVTVRAKLD